MDAKAGPLDAKCATPDECLAKALFELRRDIVRGDYEEAVNDFSAIFDDPDRFFKTHLFKSSDDLFNFRIRLLHYIFSLSEISWENWPQQYKIAVYYVVMKNVNNFPQLYRDIVFELKRIGSIEAMSLIYWLSQHREHSTSMPSDSISNPEAMDEYMKYYHSGWVTGLFNRAWGKVTDNIQGLSEEQLFTIINTWASVRYDGNPNRFMADIDPSQLGDRGRDFVVEYLFNPELTSNVRDQLTDFHLKKLYLLESQRDFMNKQRGIHRGDCQSKVLGM
jgi:hypothetical protein